MPFLLVQYPTGHKAKIEAPPNKPLIKALEDACSRRSLNHEDYIFTHNDRPVDLSLPFRLSGLVNNACLELVPKGNNNGPAAMEAAANNTVRLGVRLDNGERLVWTGNARRSLWDILSELASGHAKLAEDIASPFNPSTGSLAVVYLQEQVIGRENLERTSPTDLGIFQGSALVQLARTFAAAANEPARKPPVRPPVSAPAPNPVASKPPFQAPVQPDEDEPMPSLSAPAYAQPEFVSPFSVFAERPTQSVFGHPEPQTPSSSTGGSMASAEKPRSLGDLLGISLEPSPASEQSFPFANFQFPAETVGLDLLNKSLDESESSSLVQPVDRQPVAFRPPTTGVGSDTASLFDLPADLFELTEEDIRRLVQSYRAEWQSDQPLITAEMRRQARLRLYAKYPRAVIQFHWPDGVILQACFDPRERVSSLYEFVRMQLQDPKLDFRLFTTPPKVILKDLRATLIDANVVPLAKVYFSWTGSGSAQDVLRPDLVSNASVDNWSHAQEIVSFWMDRARSNNIHGEGLSTVPPAATTTTTAPPEGPAVPPKWFRLG